MVAQGDRSVQNAAIKNNRGSCILQTGQIRMCQVKRICQKGRKVLPRQGIAASRLCSGDYAAAGFWYGCDPSA